MNVTYHLQGIEFEWDEDKARANARKHGVTFEEAAQAFLDPFHQQGEASVTGEKREFLLGYSMAQRLLLVIHLERTMRIRIISARPATRHERKIYEES